MATTVQSIINQGRAHSVANDPGVFTETGELVEEVDNIVRSIYQAAQAENPWFFSKTAEVAASDGWARPSDALDVMEVHAATGGVDAVLTAGTRVSVVSAASVEDELPPRIYRVGQTYESPGDAGDPEQASGGDKLKFFYCHGHPPITSASQTLDSTWIEDHNKLIYLRLAVFLSLKDKARADIQALVELASGAQRLFMSDVRQTDSALVSEHQRQSGNVTRDPKPVS